MTTQRNDRIAARLCAVFALVLATALTLAENAWAEAFKLQGEPKIAFIYAASAKDGGWNEALDAGRAAVEKELGLTVAVAENVPEDATELRAAIDLFVKRGFNIIVGTTYGYSDADRRRPPRPIPTSPSSTPPAPPTRPTSRASTPAPTRAGTSPAWRRAR